MTLNLQSNTVKQGFLNHHFIDEEKEVWEGEEIQ